MIMGELLFKGSLSDEETKQIRVNGSSGIHIISYFSIDGMLKLKMILKRSLRDAFQKKPYGGTLSQPLITPSPFKCRDKTKRDIFGVLNPPPPFKNREIFIKTIFIPFLFTKSKQA